MKSEKSIISLEYIVNFFLIFDENSVYRNYKRGTDKCKMLPARQSVLFTLKQKQRLGCVSQVAQP